MRRRTFLQAVTAVPLALGLLAADSAPPPGLRLATFDIDATPPPGSQLTYDPLKDVGDLTLRCRGVVLLGAAEPIVLCAVDWIAIGNEGHDAFRDALATAAGTVRQRVCVHTLHQHDAPICDFTAETILREAKMAPGPFESGWQRELLKRLAEAVRAAVARARPVTHIARGSAEVRQVASNRRILGPDGKVRAVRFTACKDPAIRAEPEGTIDPLASVVSFWDGEQPLASLSYYATHPQSFYRTGIANPDFPGIARFLRGQALPGVLHVHFNGAGGNVGAGKYNDGSPANRPVLAARLADGLARAWDAAARRPIIPADVRWGVNSVALPPAAHLDEAALTAELAGAPAPSILGTATRLAWLRRCRSGHKIDIACLSLADVRILHLPGELFVEYQLAAKKLRPDLFVAMAAYGEYSPGYIGTAEAYPQGGYETAARSSFVAPEVEGVLMGAIQRLLRD